MKQSPLIHWLISGFLTFCPLMARAQTSAQPLGSAQHLSNTPVDLAQRQLNAYNARNLDAFLEPYADEVEIYDLPDKPISKGKDAMRKRYGTMFANTPGLHCELVNRIVVGNTVVDHERVTFGTDREPVQAIAIYKIENGKIRTVYFTR